MDRISRIRDWNLRAKALLAKLIGILEETIRCGDEFFRYDIQYFDDMDEGLESGRVIPRLRESFKKLSTCRNGLHRLQNRCDQFAQSVSFGIPLP